MAVFRIIVGVLVASVAALMWPHRLALFGYDSILSVETSRAMSSGPGQNFFLLLPSGQAADTFVPTILIMLALAGISLCIGFSTRLSALLCFVILAGLFIRNPLIEHAGYRLLVLWCAYIALSHAGNIWSLDALIARKRNRILPIMVPGWPQHLVQLQLVAVYLSAAWVKLHGPLWLDGTAVYYVLQLPSFKHYPLPDFMYSLPASKVLTWFTLLVEGLFPTLVCFKKTRAIMLMAGLSLHVGLNYAMNVPLFQLIMLAAYATFISEATYRSRWQYLCSALSKTRGKLSRELD